LLNDHDDEQARAAQAEVDRLLASLAEARDSFNHDGNLRRRPCREREVLLAKIDAARERVAGLADMVLAGAEGGVARAEQVSDALALPARRTLVTVQLLPATRSRPETMRRQFTIARGGVALWTPIELGMPSPTTGRTITT
jgi:hypothetical protein